MAEKIVAIDPGLNQSAWLIYYNQEILEAQVLGNMIIRAELRRLAGNPKSIETPDILVIERMQHYGRGMPVGTSVHDTNIWIGRFIDSWNGNFALLHRKHIASYLCGSACAGDPNIRQALIDRFGGDEIAVGRKKQPGPLYKIVHSGITGASTHLWSALAVAVTYAGLERPRYTMPQFGKHESED